MRRNYRLFKDLTTGNRSYLSESTNPRYPVYNPLSIPQNQIQLHQSGFAEEEIRTYILEKISEVEHEHRQESAVLNAQLQSENDAAKLFLDR